MWVKTSNARTNRLVNTDAIQEIQDNGMSGTVICFTDGNKISCDLKYEDWMKILKQEIA